MKSRPILPLAAVLAGLLFPGCREDPKRAAWWEAEQERIELAQCLALAQYQQRNLPEDRTPELAEIRTTERNLASRASQLTQTRAILAGEIQQLELQFDQLATQARQDQRLSAVGRKFSTLALANGKIFHDVEITNVDEVGVAIRHRDGLARLRCAELVSEHQEIFGLDATVSIAAEALERDEALAYDRWIDHELAAVRNQEQIARSTAARDEQIATLSQALRVAQAAARERVSPLAAAPSRPASSGWPDRADRDPYRSYRSRYRTVHYYPYVSYPCRTVPTATGNPFRSIPFRARTPSTSPIVSPCPATPSIP